MHDEKCSSFFYERLKERQVKKDNNNITRVFQSFYKDLYTTNKQCNPHFQTQILHRVSPKGLENNEFAVNRETLKHIVSSMKNNKTPGMDGLTAEFYKFFFDDIQDILIEVYTEINTEQTVPKSMTKAVTTVIPKKSNCVTPSDYRSITLLNIDYKILTKYLNKIYFSEFLISNISSEQLC